MPVVVKDVVLLLHGSGSCFLLQLVDGCEVRSTTSLLIHHLLRFSCKARSVTGGKHDSTHTQCGYKETTTKIQPSCSNAFDLFSFIFPSSRPLWYSQPSSSFSFLVSVFPLPTHSMMHPSATHCLSSVPGEPADRAVAAMTASAHFQGAPLAPNGDLCELKLRQTAVVQTYQLDVIWSPNIIQQGYGDSVWFCTVHRFPIQSLLDIDDIGTHIGKSTNGHRCLCLDPKVSKAFLSLLGSRATFCWVKVSKTWADEWR